MFAAARQEQIKELLLKHKQMEVLSLAATLGVTEVTIRRDLDKLEKDGFVIKTHGGAILNEAALEQNPETANGSVPAQIREFGEAVALLVNERDAVFLGSGLTCLQVAANLRNKQRLTVMTNDLKVAEELSGATGVVSIVTGGNTLPGTSALVGDLALRALEQVYFNKVIITVAGISFSHGFTVGTAEEAVFYKQLFNNSREIIIAADSSKFDQIGFAFLSELSSVHKIVTNKETSGQYKEYFFQHNVKVYTPYEVEELTAM